MEPENGPNNAGRAGHIEDTLPVHVLDEEAANAQHDNRAQVGAREGEGRHLTALGWWRPFGPERVH